MRTRHLIPVGCLLSCLAFSAFAQMQPPEAPQSGARPAKQYPETKIDRTFKTTSKDCSGVHWSQEYLKQYPDISAACQSVEMRDGKAYVKFQGTVTRNENNGREVDVAFKGGHEVRLAPPPDTKLYINNRPTPVAQLQPGDQLTFYVPEDRVVATFYPQGQTPATASAQAEAPILGQQPAPREHMARRLPSTASELPLVALAAFTMLGLGAGLTLVRLRRT